MATVMELKTFVDARGSLAVIEKDLPFTVNRVETFERVFADY